MPIIRHSIRIIFLKNQLRQRAQIQSFQRKNIFNWEVLKSTYFQVRNTLFSFLLISQFIHKTPKFINSKFSELKYKLIRPYMSISKSSASSPSLPSSEQVSGDIFFQVKKQILDKLDVILQKVNLEVIEYLKPQTQRKEDKKTFHFIELSQFEKQIQALFDYLDRLYESLNTSVSFSSNDIKNTVSNMPSGLESTQKRNQSVFLYNTALANELGQIKLKYQHLECEMHRLTQQNQHMMFMLKNNLSHSYSMGQSMGQSMNQSSKASLKNTKTDQLKVKDSQKSFKSAHQQSLESNQSSQGGVEKKAPQQMQGISLETVKKILRFYNHSIRQLSIEYKELVKEIKKILKQVKFQIIESRVECISELKKWTQKMQTQSEQKQKGQLKQVSSSKQKSQSENSHRSQRKALGLQTSFQNQSVEQNCGETCYKKNYSQKNDKIGFQEDILQKIQEILDVC